MKFYLPTLKIEKSMRLFSCFKGAVVATSSSPNRATEAFPRWNASATEHFAFALEFVGDGFGGETMHQMPGTTKAMLEVDDSGSVRLLQPDQSPDDDRKPSASYMKPLAMSTGSQHLTNGAPTEAAYLEGLCMAAAADPALGMMLACAAALLQLGKPFSREHELTVGLPSSSAAASATTAVLFGPGTNVTVKTVSWDGRATGAVLAVVLVHDMDSKHQLQHGGLPSFATLGAARASVEPEATLSLTNLRLGSSVAAQEALNSRHLPTLSETFYAFPASAGVDRLRRSPSASSHPRASTARTLPGASFLVDHVPAMVALCCLDGRVTYQVRGCASVVSGGWGQRLTS